MDVVPPKHPELVIHSLLILDRRIVQVSNKSKKVLKLELKTAVNHKNKVANLSSALASCANFRDFGDCKILFKIEKIFIRLRGIF